MVRARRSRCRRSGCSTRARFNVGTGVGTSVVDLANILLEEAGAQVPIEFAPKRPGEAQESFVDVGKAERLLGWKPRVTLREGLAQSFRWARRRDTRRRPARRA